MELSEALLKRRSVRKFLPDKVKQEDIDYILHAAMSGPSAMNTQPWEFYVVVSNTALESLKSVSRYSGYDAPLAIVVAFNLDNTLSGEMKDFAIQDVSSATENILLAATDKGLGSVWCGIYPIKQNVINLQKILNLSDNIVPLNIIYIGYPKDKVEPRDQFSKNKIHLI